HPAPTEPHTLSLHDALPISLHKGNRAGIGFWQVDPERRAAALLAENFDAAAGLLDEAEHHAQSKPGALAHFLCQKEGIKDLVARSEEHTSELQSRGHLVCRL